MFSSLSRFLPASSNNTNSDALRRNDKSRLSLSTWLGSLQSSRKTEPAAAGSHPVLQEPDGSKSALLEKYQASLERRVDGIEHAFTLFVRSDESNEVLRVPLPAQTEAEKVAALASVYGDRSKVKRGITLSDMNARELAVHALALGDAKLLNFAASPVFRELSSEMKGEVLSVLVRSPADYRADAIKMLKSDFFQSKSMMDKADLIDVLATGDKALVDYVRAYFDDVPRAQIWEMTNLAREGKAWGF